MLKAPKRQLKKNTMETLKGQTVNCLQKIKKNLNTGNSAKLFDSFENII